MAAEDTKELEFTIKGLLISRPTVVKANVLQRECQEELGRTFPFRQLGFPTFVDYLRSIPTVVQLEPHNGFNPDVYPIQSRASSHIDQLVSRQRVAPSRKRGVARRGAYNSRPAAVRRRPIRPVASRPAPPMVRPNQGIGVRDLQRCMDNNYNKNDLQRNGIRSVDELLSHAEGMVERGDTKVYPKLAGGPNNIGRSSTVKGIPAGLEDDFDDFDDEDEFYDEEAEKDSEEELSKQAIQLWSRALGEERNGSSPRPPKPEEGLDQNVDFPEEDCNISSAMINNFRKILAQYPEGIWASQLQQLYFDQFRVSLDLMNVGHTSAISLASSLPSVFTFRREGPHDWKLYDARYVTQESLDAQVNGGDVLLSENARYIPQTIIEKIKKLLENYPNGFRSTDLLQLYRETFSKSLDLEILGFNTLEEFLMILKNDVTLKKALNYYLLLPKHKLVSHDALQPSRPDERLIVPAEALGMPIPENVLRLGEEILLQELPPVEMDPAPDRPLLELEVRVAEVITPAFFYMTLGNMYEEMEKMMDDLEKFYEWEEANFKIPLPHIAMNLYCAAKYDNFWHRAKITRIKSHGNIEIEFIDYGTPATMQSSELRYLSKEFAYLPAQAVCAKLMGVKPTNGEAKFPPEVASAFLNLVDNKRLVAHVYQVAARERMQLDVILFDVENPDQEIVINDYLVENGLASHISQTQESSSEVQHPVGSLLPESDVFSFQGNGPSQPSSSTSLPETVTSSVLGNASTSLPTSSVNRFRQISRTLKQYVISRHAVRDRTKAQFILYKYTSATFSIPEEGGDEEHSSETSNPVTNGLTNGSENESKQDNSDTGSLDVSPILEKIKSKKKYFLFSSLKANVNKGKSELELSQKENINTLNSSELTNGTVGTLNSDVITNGTIDPLNSGVITNGTIDPLNSGVITNGTIDSLNSGLHTNETLNPKAVSNNDIANEDGSVSQTLDGAEIPKNVQCHKKLNVDFSYEFVGSEVPEVETCLSNSEDKVLDFNSNEAKSLKAVYEIDVKAIILKTKPNKLKNLFGKPTLPK